MPICPHCSRESPRRKKDCCPICGKEVHIVREGRGKNKKTIWVANGTSSAELVYLLEEHIKKYNQLPNFTFGDPGDFDNGGAKKRYMQMGTAKTLLKWCGYDQELAIAVIDAYFDGTRRLYPCKSMQGVIGKQFQLAKSIASKRLEQERVQEEADKRNAQHANELTYVEIFMPL